MPSASGAPAGSGHGLQGYRGQIAILSLLALATGAAHAPALWAGFLYDDRNDVLLNPSARAATFIERLPATVRPLLKATYAAQDALGGMNPVAFHAVNLGLHLATVVLLYLLMRRALRLTGPDRPMVAGMAVLLWALHPALTDTVSYVSGRSMGLSSGLLIASLLAATGPKPRPILAGGFALLAPLARETALVAPLLLLAWQVTIAKEPPTRALRRALPVWTGALLAALIIAAMARHRELIAFSLDQRGPLDTLRANVFAIPEILRLWLAPWRLSVLPTQPVTGGWADAATLIRISALTALPALALVLRRRMPVLALAVLWTLIALIPTNSILWRVDPVAVRPLYLAGVGLSLMLALALGRLRHGIWLAAPLAAGLAVMTWHRATLYQDEVALFTDAADKAPKEARTQAMLGLVLANAGRLDEAQTALRTALRIDPFQTEALNALRLIKAGAPIYSAPAP